MLATARPSCFLKLKYVSFSLSLSLSLSRSLGTTTERYAQNAGDEGVLGGVGDARQLGAG